MTDLVVRAEGGIIWLVVGVFWVIAQIAGAAAKKNQTLRPPVAPSDEPEETQGDPFAELLRKMAGTQPFEVPKPAYEEEPVKRIFTPSPARQSGSRTTNPSWKPGDIEALPDMKPLQRVTHKPPAPASVPPAIDVRPKTGAFRSSVPSIKMPTMNLSFRGSETSVQNAPNLGKIISPSDKNSLRRAMLSHIIFSPPKALSRTSE